MTRTLIFCNYPGCDRRGINGRASCDEHQGMCRIPGCPNPKRSVQASKFCEEHCTSNGYVLKSARIIECVCPLCGTEFESRVAMYRRKYRFRLCDSCTTEHRAKMRSFIDHGVTEELALSWLRDPKCWVCRQPIAFRNSEYAERTAVNPSYHVDHDHRCCAGAHGCAKCVRGLSHPKCNLRIGNLEIMLNQVGFDRFLELVDAIL